MSGYWKLSESLDIEQAWLTVAVRVIRGGKTWLEAHLRDTYYGYSVGCPAEFGSDVEAHDYAEAAVEFIRKQRP